MIDRLTIRKTYSIEELMEWINECNSVGIEQDMARQLIATMQREAKLRDALEEMHALYAETDRTLDATEVCGKAQELLYCSE